MSCMEDSMPHAPREAWKRALAWVCALLLAVLFVVSGLWKILFPLDWSARLTQMTFPGWLSTPVAVGVGIAEAFGGTLLAVPRFRRWGAFVVSALLVVFMAFVGWNYNTLRGEECSCFPWLKRSVGPGFFIGDGLMLAMAGAAWAWSVPAWGARGAGMVLGAITVFAGASFGMTVTQQSGLEAPARVSVDGKPYALNQGRVFLYFFDPECRHCFDAAQRMSKWNWRDAKIVGIPTRVPQFAGQFLADTGLKAAVTNDLETLRGVFKFTDPPYGVMLEHGRQKLAAIHFDEREPHEALAKAGYVE